MTASERRKLRERLRDHADPALLERVEHHRDRAAALGLRGDGRAPLRRIPEADPCQFRLREQSFRLAGEPREVERPPEIADGLAHRTPQALLRDLHRPVREPPPIHLRPHPVPGGLNWARSRVRDAVTTRYRIRVQDEPDPRRMLASALRELRELLSEPWERALPSQPKVSALEPGPEDMFWFGSQGGYDPDR